MEKGFWSWTNRILIWTAIALALLVGLVYLSWCDIINPSHFVGVLIVSLSPLALLPMLQHAAFTKLPWLRPVLEFPSIIIEKGMDRAINSSPRPTIQRYSDIIKNRLGELEIKTPDCHETCLWKWWFEELRTIKGEVRAKKVFDRLTPSLNLKNAYTGRNICRKALF